MNGYVIVRKFGSRFFALDCWGQWNSYTRPDVIRFACSGSALRVLMNRVRDDRACVHRIS